MSHHIISDGWSRSNLYRELSIAYTALAANTSVDLPELPVQFADYSARQRRWAKSAAFEEQAAYWKAQLAGQLESLNLPRDGDRSVADLACGDECSLEIDRKLVSALKARAQDFFVPNQLGENQVVIVGLAPDFESLDINRRVNDM